MNFTVYTDANGASDSYGGDAMCQRDGAILIVEDEERHVLYGPNGWIRVEADEEIGSETRAVVEVCGSWPPISVVMPDPISAFVTSG